MRKNRAIRYTHVIHIRVDEQLYDVLKGQYADSIRDALRTAYRSQIKNEPACIEKTATVEPKEPILRQQKTPPLFIDKKTYKDKETGFCSYINGYPQSFNCSSCNKINCAEKA